MNKTIKSVLPVVLSVLMLAAGACGQQELSETEASSESQVNEDAAETSEEQPLIVLSEEERTEKVVFQEEFFEALVCLRCGKTADSIVKGDLEDITDLSVTLGKNTPLDDILLFPNLRELEINSFDEDALEIINKKETLDTLKIKYMMTISKRLDASLLADLKNITHLDISGNRLKDGLDVLTGLQQIEILDVSDCGLEDIDALPQFKNLREVYLYKDNIADYSPLLDINGLAGIGITLRDSAAMDVINKIQTLERIHIKSNKMAVDLEALTSGRKLLELTVSGGITDISVLSGQTELNELNLSENQIEDLTPLAGLVKLRKLSLASNKISDVSALEALTELTYLDLNDNAISDIGAIHPLSELTELRLGSNSITDISALSGMTKMKLLHLHSNNISDVEPLSDLVLLSTLFINNNQIDDISALRKHPLIFYLEAGGNSIGDIAPLADMPLLSMLSLSQNNITDLRPLKDLGNLMFVLLDDNPIAQTADNQEILSRLKADCQMFSAD